MAQPEPSHMGDAGQFLLNGSFVVENVSWQGEADTGIRLSAGIRHFLVDNLALGFDLLFTYGHSGSDLDDYSSYYLYLVPACGYKLKISDAFSFFPQVEVALQITSYDTGALGQSSRLTRIGLGGYLPFVFHPSGHLFFGIGPGVMVDVSSSRSGGTEPERKLTTLGARTVLGAWF